MSVLRLTCPHCREVLQLAKRDSPVPVVCSKCRRPCYLRNVTPGWYYVRDHQEYGPISRRRLKKRAAKGKLGPNDLVKPPGATHWRLASSVTDLFTLGPDTPRPAEAPASERTESAAEEWTKILAAQGVAARGAALFPLQDYQIIRKIGAGAMGAVYQAYQRKQHRLVALKVLSRPLVAQPGYLPRFSREAGVLARLEHPHLVRFYEAGEDQGFYYYAMEFVDGFGLVDLLERLGGRMSVADAVFIALRCAEALRYAHERRIIHRDVKPHNILLTHQGRVKLTDMGLAKPTDDDGSLTQTGIGVGTPKYMAPEQARNAKCADHRCDLYALGATMYHLLTGEVPFEQDNLFDLVHAKETGDFVPARRLNTEVPLRLDGILRRLMDPRPCNRYQSGAKLIADLEGLGVDRPTLSFSPALLMEDPAPAGAGEGQPRCLEILLAEDEPADVLLTQEALDEGHVRGRLHVVRDGKEVLAFLHRQEEYRTSPRPDLIIAGRSMKAAAAVQLAAGLKGSPDWREVPLLVLTESARDVEEAPTGAVPVAWKVARPEGLATLQNILHTAHDFEVTVVEIPCGPKARPCLVNQSSL